MIRADQSSARVGIGWERLQSMAASPLAEVLFPCDVRYRLSSICKTGPCRLSKMASTRNVERGQWSCVTQNALRRACGHIPETFLA